MKLRIATSSLLYDKCLRVSSSGANDFDPGQVINLVSTDAMKLDLPPKFAHYLWVGPLEVLAVLYLLYNSVGLASILVFVILTAIIPFQVWLGFYFSRLRLKILRYTDERMRIMSEVVGAMRVVKLYGWEKYFIKLVGKARAKEIKLTLKYSLVKAANLTLNFFELKLVILVTVFYIVRVDHLGLRAQQIFPAVSLFAILQMSVCLYIPKAIEVLAEAWVSLKRMEKFLTLPDSDVSMAYVNDSYQGQMPSEMATDDDAGQVSFHTRYNNVTESSVVTYFKADDDREIGTIQLNDVDAFWGKTQVLNNISVDIKKGDLLAVAGPVGCGKSSVLMALLRELPLRRGTAKIKGRVAYASQQSWITSGTVRDNILMGQNFKQSKYEEVIRACALKADLHSFPDSDMTIVGEQGAALSGGQRARLSLARAVYSGADILLLDDPLSAVDAAVAKQLFDNCIKGVLATKTVVLVSHQVQFLQSADQVLLLKAGGQTHHYGTYEEMVEKGIEFDSVVEGAVDDKRKSSAGDGANQEMMTTRMSVSAYERRWTLARPSRIDRASVMSHSHGDFLGADPDNFLWSRLSAAKMNNEDENQEIEEMKREREDVESRARHSGNVNWRVYGRYFTSGGSWFGLILLILFQLIYQGIYITSDYWLSFWTRINEENATTPVSLAADDKISDVESIPWFVSNCRNGSMSFGCLETYLVLILSLFVLGLARSFYTFYICVKGSDKLHNAMFRSIIRAPMNFFDNNPIGKILSRFSQDIDWMDILIPYTSFSASRILVLIFGSILVTLLINPWLILGLVPLCVGFYFLRKYYLSLSRNIKRLEGITRSPMSTHVNSTLSGIYTIRSLKAESYFFDSYCQYQDVHTSTWFLFQATARWFALRMEIMCAIFTAFVAFFAILASSTLGLNAGLVGLSLTYALSLTGWFQWGVRQSADLENQMVSVERVAQYTNLPQEPDLVTADGKIAKVPPPVWPEDGGIVARAVNFRYSADSPVILHDVTLDIRPREKIGIVGRTGAGKSSFLQMLFRMGSVEGHLYIDGIDASSIQLSHLRSNIAIIPQEPVILSATVRKNLDPLDEHEDADVWNALADVKLKETVKAMTYRLETDIDSSTFSVGQSQIFCLARAILRNNRIVVVDEATANLDNPTDELVQKTIRERFSQCTVLTIAHRLQTIIDSDRVLVMDAGRVAEFDSPHLLLRDNGSQFSELARKTGQEEFERLKRMAEVAYGEKMKKLQGEFAAIAELGGADESTEQS